MKLIVGLGNPGEEYTKTRHNLGFMAVDALQAALAGSAWKLSKKHRALLSEAPLKDDSIVLAKPQTFMNLSGEAVASIKSFYKLKPSDVWIIHDDKDLPLGTIRIRDKGSSGGHNGVQSIIDHLKTEHFLRFRLGIASISSISSNQLSKMKSDTSKFVLATFAKSELHLLKHVLEEVVHEVQERI